MTDSPIFIGGMFKSGTTLLRAMLGQHPAVFSGLETQWFNLDFSHRSSAAFRTSMSKLAQFFDVALTELRAWEERSGSAEELLDRLMHEVTKRAGKSRWVEKTPGNVARMPRIFARWPNAKVLHIIRDPRDVFASMCEAGKGGTPRDFVTSWKSIVAVGISDAAGNVGINSRYKAIRYEELVRRPAAVMGGVLEFICLDWDDRVASFSGNADDFERVQKVTGHASTTLRRLQQPLSEKRIGCWRETLSEDRIAELLRESERQGVGMLMKSCIYDG